MNHAVRPSCRSEHVPRSVGSVVHQKIDRVVHQKRLSMTDMMSLQSHAETIWSVPTVPTLGCSARLEYRLGPRCHAHLVYVADSRFAPYRRLPRTALLDDVYVPMLNLVSDTCLETSERFFGMLQPRRRVCVDHVHFIVGIFRPCERSSNLACIAPCDHNDSVRRLQSPSPPMCVPVALQLFCSRSVLRRSRVLHAHLAPAPRTGSEHAIKPRRKHTLRNLQYNQQ